ncbi:hypothetical protein F4806DRAFT_356628 [Annulohypoxylon nitens]|nr:hypothetical protein F4806DRAFT_356628 [Annulohypoxylon nitens]
MESIKKWFSPPKGKKHQTDTNSEHRVSSLLESLSKAQEESNVYHGRRNAICVSTMSFVPRTQGHEATIAFLESGATSDLSWLLRERDRAERFVSRGPRTKATKEVLEVIRKPSIKTVEKFNRVYMQAEMLMKYGIAGEIVYNYSKPLSWNKANMSRLTSMQLKDLRAMIYRLPRRTPSIPRNPPTPIDWFDLGASRTTPFRRSRQSPIVSEPDGWRDLPPSPGVQDDNIEDDWEIQEAQIVTMTKIPMNKVRIVKCKGQQSK